MSLPLERKKFQAPTSSGSSISEPAPGAPTVAVGSSVAASAVKSATPTVSEGDPRMGIPPGDGGGEPDGWYGRATGGEVNLVREVLRLFPGGGRVFNVDSARRVRLDVAWGGTSANVDDPTG